MKPGDPFLTKDLDELRAEQRRDLRLIDDTVAVGDDRRGSGPLRYPLPVFEVRGDDGRLAERYMRARARDLREQISDGLERMAEAVQARAAHRILNQTAGELRPWVVDVLTGAAAHFDTHSGEPARERRETIMQYATLLALADAFADDGYRDPRLPEPVD